MYMLQRHAKLHKPLHDLALSEVPALLLCLLDLVREVAHLAKFHNYDQFTFFEKARPIGHYMGMIQLSKQH